MAPTRLRFNAARILVGVATVLALVLAGGFIFVQFIEPNL